jgi:hypothetical protein
LGEDRGRGVDAAAFGAEVGGGRLESSISDPLYCSCFNELDVEPGRGTSVAEEPSIDLHGKPLDTVLCKSFKDSLSVVSSPLDAGSASIDLDSPEIFGLSRVELPALSRVFLALRSQDYNGYHSLVRLKVAVK